MSTYEARCASAGAASGPLAEQVVTPERIEAAILRGRRERSLAMWAMLQAVFGRPDARDRDEAARLDGERPVPMAR